MLSEGDAGRERPLLPSLTELVVVDISLYALSTLPLCDTLMKRVEQGVPLEMLDLCMCLQDPKSRTAVTQRNRGRRPGSGNNRRGKGTNEI
jgi:hypothetical protein